MSVTKDLLSRKVCYTHKDEVDYTPFTGDFNGSFLYRFKSGTAYLQKDGTWAAIYDFIEPEGTVIFNLAEAAEVCLEARAPVPVVEETKSTQLDLQSLIIANNSGDAEGLIKLREAGLI